MQNRITISKTKIAPINKIYKSGKYRKPKNHIDWNRYKDINFKGERFIYAEALNNQVNKDYKVSYASDSLTLIQSFNRISFNKLKEFTNLTGQSNSFHKILLGLSGNLVPALRSTASNNPIKHHKDLIADKAKDKYDNVIVREKPTDMITIDL